MDALKTLTSKPEKFDGKNFLCWQQHMKFWLTELGLFYIIYDSLKEQVEKSDKTLTNGDISKKVDDPKKDDIDNKDVIYHGCILGALFDNVYHIFSYTKTACDLWTALDQRYATAERGLVRVGINYWLDFSLLITKICPISFMILKTLCMS